ncbi:MAG TPA: hypothetical protein VMW69_05175 [Spirochaetia bacterium]|nr:hypothetical protein [Spirochaetia bacterium]
MSTYQFFIILHGLKDVLVWLVPLLVAVIFCATALAISTRWMRQRKSTTTGFDRLEKRVDELEARLAALDRSTDAGNSP